VGPTLTKTFLFEQNDVLVTNTIEPVATNYALDGEEYRQPEPQRLGED
jgi:hypothetical protein